MQPVTQGELDALVQEIVRGYAPQKIILFGSLATGQAHKDSDIDLALIKKTASPYCERIEEIVRSCRWKWGLPVEIIVYTPEEFESENRNNPFVRDEISTKGKVLYVAA